ncbi:anhydro-N-acetylmuramic acid kinase [Acaryochloris sp. 'Moss Beach']|uniref:anhydro-N-acetylmuramic acid kinase n=1 Tax=Acaryochloris sp. 'Moss Beach' TaxID=2740837 RepID=UPI001F467EED|nr:anhydro-N-acetylmuramic acid kinase [Acaryochloris sp. 'Moss Beach']UJB71494.1 anhydro-N-acetylmuramic acid kinase [Acaryochloris sp. 'Moss Beach']
MRVIGLMSGTSVDGIDAALVDISGQELDLQVDLIASQTYPYPDALRDQILAVCAGEPLSIEALAILDDGIATQFAQAAQAIQADATPTAELIGSHGQTVFHRPPQDNLGYTLQLGRGAVIAYQTSINTVSNFRVADMAAGGQGAPLVSKLDICLLSHPEFYRCVQNVGGIGNVTYLPPLADGNQLGVGVKGWDTGPANVLMDLAVAHFSKGELTYDADGAWAAQGTPCQPLIEEWLRHPFFLEPPPKSTGRELFSPDYLQTCLQTAVPYQLSPADMLATLTDFTAATIVYNYDQFLPHPPDQVVLCGGGSRNGYLRQCLQQRVGSSPVLTADDLGLSADAKEAIAFAVLAYWRQLKIPGNVPTVTGAKGPVLLGELHLV